MRVALHGPPRIRNTETGTRARPADSRNPRRRRLPSVAIEPRDPPLPEISLTLEPAAIGSFDARPGPVGGNAASGCSKDSGQRGLAYLESLFLARMSDVILAFENQRPNADSGAIRVTLQSALLKGCSPAPLANYLKASESYG